ncbi:MAG: type 2 isopentenyl-diphosphate Delta-isomerase [Candidatus Kapabacteria bacterium]|nr:type 2 isopentenyl-diphosphate Delta-isomerase [Candidatus Kapabacteria bacterium]
MSIPSRKESHVRHALDGDVSFRTKTNGLDDYEFEYNALPEINLADVSTRTEFLSRPLKLPLMVTGMTGGYPDAVRINTEIATACAECGIAMGVGSMRAALEDPSLTESFACVRPFAKDVPLVANIGAVQAVRWHGAGVLDAMIRRAVEMIDAAALAVHLNPLQELAQPEGEPEFRGVLSTIEWIVRHSPVPIIVKEVGAGLSRRVIERLRNVGVEYVDVAGAGGTSWSGIEILRHENPAPLQHLWDVGIPTAECIAQSRDLVPTLIASGGIASGSHVAVSIGLGANIVGAARPLLQAHNDGGIEGILQLVGSWETTLRQWMFLSGSSSITELRSAPLRRIH